MLKKEQKIKERILHIENGLFEEEDVKLLLIEIREKLKEETFLKEIEFRKLPWCNCIRDDKGQLN